MPTVILSLFNSACCVHAGVTVKLVANESTKTTHYIIIIYCSFWNTQPIKSVLCCLTPLSLLTKHRNK